MPGSSPPPVASQHQAVRPPSSPPDSRHNHAVTNSTVKYSHARTRATPEQHHHQPPPPHHPDRQPFSWSSSLLTMLTTLGCFAALCAGASATSTRFALHAAAPVYGLYPPLVAAMLVGGCCALVCYVPTMLAVLAFYALFGADIRKRHSPPPRYEQGDGRQGTGVGMGMGWSVLRDGANTIKLALVVAPVYAMALGRGGGGLSPGPGLGLGGVQSRALDAAAGGQLAAAVMTLRILFVGVREIWDLVPLVMFKWDRDARAQEHE